VLEEAGDKTELFLVDECDDMEAASIEGRADVIYQKPAEDWFDLGGLVDGQSPIPADQDNSFFCQKWWVASTQSLGMLYMCYYGCILERVVVTLWDIVKSKLMSTLKGIS